MKLDEKEQLLIERLRELKSFGVAYSGGTDSSLVLKVARDNEIVSFCACMAVAPVFFPHELERGKEFCRKCRISLIETRFDFFGSASIVKNDSRRCYYCKKKLFGEIKKLVQDNGYTYLVDGTNASDLSDFRAGIDAADELGVVSPLRECGIKKEDVRQLAKKYDIPFWNEPASACLASRIPQGDIITADKIETVLKGELFLKNEDLNGPRLRHHGKIARIEVREDDFELISGKTKKEHIVKGLKDLGFKYVTLDIEGYRTGST
jgi:uncharacterized protein